MAWINRTSKEIPLPKWRVDIGVDDITTYSPEWKRWNFHPAKAAFRIYSGRWVSVYKYSMVGQ
jgi:hypothetical protein